MARFSRALGDQDMSIADINAAIDHADDAGDISYQGAPMTSGAHVYRILYRTERGDPNNLPGYSERVALLPQVPRLGMGTRSP